MVCVGWDCGVYVGVFFQKVDQSQANSPAAV